MFYQIQCLTFIGLCNILSDSIFYIHWPVQCSQIQCLTFIGLCKVLLSQAIQLLLELGGLLLLLLQRCLQVGPLQWYPWQGVALLALRAAKALAALHTAVLQAGL